MPRQTRADAPGEQLPLAFADAAEGHADADVAAEDGGRLPERITPMRPTDGEGPFDHPGYFFEPWWPGIRAQAFIEDGRVRLRAEALSDPTAAFPELQALPGLVKGDRVVLDVTLLVLDATTRPNQTFLGRRLDAPTSPGTRISGVKSLDATSPVEARPLGTAAVVAQDLLYLEGRSLAGRPFGERHGELAALLAPSPWCLPGRGFIGDGGAVAIALGEMGFRGLSARRLDARLRSGPAGDAWYRVPVVARQRELPPFLAIFSRLPL